MFAVIKTGGKQYKVAAGDRITAMTLPGSPGDTIAFDHVLMLVREGHTEIGTPYVKGASVAAEIVEHKRGDKVIAFKKRRRQNSKRKRGHKQDLTVVKITEFLTGGAKAKVTVHAAPVALAAPLMAAAAPAAAEPAVAKPVAAKPVAAAPAVAKSVAAAPANAAPAAKPAVTAPPPAARTVTLSAAPITVRASVEAAPAMDTTKFRKLDKAHGKPDDLELIGGIGPTIAKKLNGLGIFHFWQIAAMTADDIASVEHDVGFAGRAERDEWKAQAGELMAGKPPRAKVDQEKAAKKPSE